MKAKILLLFEIAKYTFGCGLNLCLKILLNAILTHYNLPLYVSYLIAQLIILASSFFYHYKITFSRSFESWSSVLKAFKLYVPSVICFNILDYILVVCLAHYLEDIIRTKTNLTIESQQIINSITILTVSCIVFALRFIVYRFIFKKSTKSSDTTHNNSHGNTHDELLSKSEYRRDSRD